MEGKIIAVWGSPESGKSTFAVKLATAIYSSFQTSVITLFTSMETPMLPILFPFTKKEDMGSVGVPLSKTDVEQSDIINNLITVKELQNFGFLGYKTGENKFTYPKFGKAKAESLLNELTRLSDYVIVDCSSILENDILAQTAIEKADQIIRVSSPDLKSLCFYISQLPVYADGKYRLYNLSHFDRHNVLKISESFNSVITDFSVYFDAFVVGKIVILFKCAVYPFEAFVFYYG